MAIPSETHGIHAGAGRADVDAVAGAGVATGAEAATGAA